MELIIEQRATFVEECIARRELPASCVLVGPSNGRATEQTSTGSDEVENYEKTNKMQGLMCRNDGKQRCPAVCGLENTWKTAHHSASLSNTIARF